MVDVIVVDHGDPDALASVMRAFRAVRQVGRVITVDGTGDRTGENITRALDGVTTDRVIFADGDLSGFTAGHAAVLAGDYRGVVRGRISGYFRVKSGPLNMTRLAPCLTGVRAMPAWLPRGIVLAGLAYNEQLNLGAVLCGLESKFIDLDGVRVTTVRDHYDHALFLSWFDMLRSGKLAMIPQADPAAVRAVFGRNVDKFWPERVPSALVGG